MRDHVLDISTRHGLEKLKFTQCCWQFAKLSIFWNWFFFYFINVCSLVIYSWINEGIKRPSPSQRSGIVPSCKGLDVIVQAPAGCGKTWALCIAVPQQIDCEVKEWQASGLTPTRELAQGIERLMRVLGNYLEVKIHAYIGGKIFCQVGFMLLLALLVLSLPCFIDA